MSKITKQDVEEDMRVLKDFWNVYTEIATRKRSDLPKSAVLYEICNEIHEPLKGFPRFIDNFAAFGIFQRNELLQSALNNLKMKIHCVEVQKGKNDEFFFCTLSDEHSYKVNLDIPKGGFPKTRIYGLNEILLCSKDNCQFAVSKKMITRMSSKLTWEIENLEIRGIEPSAKIFSVDENGDVLSEILNYCAAFEMVGPGLWEAYACHLFTPDKNASKTIRLRDAAINLGIKTLERATRNVINVQINNSPKEFFDLMQEFLNLHK